MHFHNHFCWYLDNTFCGSLHESYESFDVEVLLGVVGLGLWTIGLCVFLRQLVKVIRRILKREKGSTCFNIAEAGHCLSLCSATFRAAPPPTAHRCPW